MNIPAIEAGSAVRQGLSLGRGADASTAGAASFTDTLAKAVDAVNTLQLQAEGGAQALASGTAANVHDVTIAMEQAGIALQLVGAVRNRAVEAYQEIMRMSV
jgi:flagellar hook-basal body complex protein FliE